MRYTYFEFENFKGVRNARLDLAGADQRIYTLVGLNESGKTTVLDAIDRFRTTGESEVSPKAVAGWVQSDPHDLIPISERSNFNGEIVISCGVELDPDDVEAAKAHMKEALGYKLEGLSTELTVCDVYKYVNSTFKSRVTRWIGLNAAGKSKSGRLTRPIETVSSGPGLVLTRFLRTRMPVIWYFPNFLFEFPERIYLEAAKDEPREGPFYRALFQDILDAVGKGLTLEDHVIARARSTKHSDRESLRQVLLDAGREVTATVLSAWDRVLPGNKLDARRVVIDWGEEESEETDEEGEPLPGKLYVEFRLEDNDGLFAVTDRSLGFRWFFVYLLLTTYRGRRALGQSDLWFLFDEPASNLHSTAQSALLSSLRGLSAQASIIYTTHSHHLIEPAWLGSTFVVANERVDPRKLSGRAVARNTDIRITPYRRFAAEHPNQAYFFQPILDVLDYAPSKLELVPSVVMVEGKSDYYLLDYAQRFLTPPSGERPRLNFLPGGGAGTLDTAIQLYVAWGRAFVALLDGDDAGQRERRRYTEKFGTAIGARLLLLPEVAGDSSATGIESILSKADQLAFQKVTDPASSEPDKKTFARGVQEALAAELTVKISDPGKRKLERVLVKLAEALTQAMGA